MLTGWKKAIVQIILVTAVLAGGAVLAWRLINLRRPPQRVERTHQGPLVTAVVAAPQDMTVVVTGFGTVQARNMVDLVPEVSGRVEWVQPNLASGGYVPADTTLVQVERTDYEFAERRLAAAVERARTALEIVSAEALVAAEEWRRLQPDEPSPSSLVLKEPQVREAEATLAAAQADLDKARIDLQRTALKLPFAARVISESVDVGQYVARGQPLARLYGIATVEIPVRLEDRELAWFDLPSPDPGNSESGAAAEVIAVFAGAEHRWPGVVVRTEALVDERTRMVGVIVEVADPFAADAGRPPLAPGMFTRVKITGRQVRDVFVLPRHIVHNGDRVWLVEDGRLQIRDVVVLRRQGDTVLISDGLLPGEQVITTALDAVTDGMKVRVIAPD